MQGDRIFSSGWRSALLLSTLLAGVGCTGGRAVRPDSTAPAIHPAAPIAQIHLQPLRQRLRTVNVRIGSENQKFLLDTASGLTVISPDTARRVGCEPWGRLTGFRMFGERLDMPQCTNIDLEIDGYKVHASTVGVFDMMPYLAKGSEPLAGLLGLDLFADQALTLDVAGNLLTVESPDSLAARTASMHQGRMRIGRESQGLSLSVFTAVPTARGDAWFELDSGNGGTVLVGKHIAPLLELEPEKKEAQHARFQVEGAATVEHDVLVTDMILDGNLGMPFISRWVLTFDLARSKLWMAPGSADSGGAAGSVAGAPSGSVAGAPSGSAAGAPSGSAASAPSGSAAGAPSGSAASAPSGSAAGAPSGTAASAPSGSAASASPGPAAGSADAAAQGKHQEG